MNALKKWGVKVVGWIPMAEDKSPKAGSYDMVMNYRVT
jgi:hypothetical protein